MKKFLRQRYKVLEDHPDMLKSKNDLAMLYKEQGDYSSTKPLPIKAVEGWRLKFGDTHPHTVESLNNIIELYQVWVKPEKAEKWCAKLSQIECAEQ